METIKEAKQYLGENWEQGVNCPCCHQRVQLYRRKLTTSMVLGLIDLYHQSGKSTTKPVHIKKISIVNGGEFAQMKRWGLIVDVENDDSHKRTSGLWHITSLGVEFVRGNTHVPAYVFTYNGDTRKRSAEMTNIRTALGNKFSYSELMSGQGEWL